MTTSRLCNSCSKWFDLKNKYETVCNECWDKKEYKSNNVSNLYKNVFISGFQPYISNDFDGQTRFVTSLREETALCEKFGVVRHSEFKRNFPVSQQQKNHEELINDPIEKREGISFEYKSPTEKVI